MKYKEYKKLNLIEIFENIKTYWINNNIFQKSQDKSNFKNEFVFYEGPPSANGLPGIHHVLSRTIKDIFCRYQTLKGNYVQRKAGWDTHGLPIELSVEKELGITKDDIGTKISIEDYNAECKKAVMKYTKEWDNLTENIGFWLDLKNPYITYDNKYIETVWWILKKLYDRNLLYKDYKIQPYSPAAGSGLSTHELNQPGCYKDVTDTSITAQFKIIKNDTSLFLFEQITLSKSSANDIYMLAWTTTPWTLPANSGLCVGKNIIYVLIETLNPYTFQKINVILAKDLISTYFDKKGENLPIEKPEINQNYFPYKILTEFIGEKLVGIKYEQLMPYVKVEGRAFEVVEDDFVSTSDGTGIVHSSGTFGADDYRVLKKNNLSVVFVKDDKGKEMPIVDSKGRYTKELGEFAGRGVKPEFEEEISKNKNYKSLDVEIAIKLKESGKAFNVKKYVHNYPHCWRTDKPILYYPMESWFVKTTEYKKYLIENNKKINWKPESTGSGRFGVWLENLQDWNLSRSRFWGIGIPIWCTEDKSEIKCIGSFKELKEELLKAIEMGITDINPLKDFEPDNYSDENYLKFDCHRPYIDKIILVSESGKPMYRETDLIDVWFDSGSMPFAQWHYPFENKDIIENKFPADFINEGVDQTRGWFFTLHTISTLVFNSIAFKNVVSNGLVLDKNGQKMSKRLGNSVNPNEVLTTYGPDALRWYMITNSQPWDNLKFDVNGIQEVIRKFFGTLYNTYSFFALYANIDEYDNKKKEIHYSKRPELDQWIISKLNSLVEKVEKAYDEYEPTIAGRIIEEFTIDDLSNWYIRLSRRRFWKSENTEDKLSAYQTLYQCLVTISKLISPISPFFSESIYIDLYDKDQFDENVSVHLSAFPKKQIELINNELENKIDYAKNITSLCLSLRKKAKIRVRQPLRKLIIPYIDEAHSIWLKETSELIKAETNIFEIEEIKDSELLVKEVKPNFKILGNKLGKKMKSVSNKLGKLKSEDVREFEKSGKIDLKIEKEEITIYANEVEFISKDVKGWMVNSDSKYTVALDTNLDDSLIKNGLSREIINKIQNIRKDSGFNVSDKITVQVYSESKILNVALNEFEKYICTEILAEGFEIIEKINEELELLELIENIKINILIKKI